MRTKTVFFRKIVPSGGINNVLILLIVQKKSKRECPAKKVWAPCMQDSNLLFYKGHTNEEAVFLGNLI